MANEIALVIFFQGAKIVLIVQIAVVVMLIHGLLHIGKLENKIRVLVVINGGVAIKSKD